MKEEVIPEAAVEAAAGHWSAYAPGTGWGHRYRTCLICNRTWRNKGEKSLIHKGKKAAK